MIDRAIRLRAAAALVALVTLGALVTPIVSAPRRAGQADDRGSALRSWRALRFGLFVHFGLYSMPGGVWNGRRVTRGYSEQIRAWAPISRDEYASLARRFDPVRWDPDAVCALARDTGMRYVVLTAKHHDGFSLFDTAHGDFDVVDATPYGRDIVGELAQACRRQGVGLGLYFSIIDWHHPDATEPEPQANSNPIPAHLADLVVGQLEELLTRYGDVVELWFDMGQPTPDQSRRFASTVRRLQPRTMISGRVWNHQGDFTVLGDNEVADSPIREPWQSVESMFHETWGYRSWQARDDLPGVVAEKVRRLSRTVALGGNFLLNVGPRGDGSLVAFEVEVLRGVGDWMRVHEAAIHGTAPQPFFEALEFGYATHRPGTLYLHVHDAPADGVLRLPGLRNDLRAARVLGHEHLAIAIEGVPGARQVRLPPSLRGGQGSRLAPVLVVAVDHDGEIDVAPPLAPADGSGTVTLDVGRAYRHLARNGFGYMEPPVLTALTWDFRVAEPGPYEVSIATRRPAGDVGVERGGAAPSLELDVGGRRLPVGSASDATGLVAVVPVGRVQPRVDRPLRWTVRPSRPAPGLGLGAKVIEIRLVPVMPP